jgi:heterodisulfide reductase subunit B
LEVGAAKLAWRIEEEIGENVYKCYQCIRCTSGCPLAEHFDLSPNQVMRAIQLGQEDMVLHSKTIWLCASCETCSTRCPQGLDLPRIMDHLKVIARQRGIPPKVPEVATFQNIFIRDIRLLGRLYELGLMGELNLRTKQPLKDIPMGLEMIRKGKIKLLPDLSRYFSRGKGKTAKPGQIAYYPGCSLHSTASELNASAHVVCKELNLDLVEPEGWVCCGSSPAHSTDPLLATVLPIKNLSLIEQGGFTEATAPCVACFSRFRTAMHQVEHDPQLKTRVDSEVGYKYQGRVRVLSLLDLLMEKMGLPAIQQKVKVPLNGLKVVAYYGCLLTRPPAVMQVDHPEYPMELDQLLEALGADCLDWSYKTDCCGGSLSLTQTSLAVELSRKIVENARAVGAEAIAVACPLCHTNLDARQHQMGLNYSLPVIYFTQLMGVAFGVDEKKLALGKLMVDPYPLLREKGFIH